MKPLFQKRGMITICSYCKRIRDLDRWFIQTYGTREELEEAYPSISDGICNECYENFFKNINKRYNEGLKDV